MSRMRSFLTFSLVLLLLTGGVKSQEFELFATLKSPPNVTSTAGAKFGKAVAAKGDVLVVTENQFAHVYRRIAKKDWMIVTTLQSDEDSTTDNFGFSVAFDGTTIAVSAPEGGDSGVIYLYEERVVAVAQTERAGFLRCHRIFHRKCDDNENPMEEEARWELVQKISRSNGTKSDEYGYRLSMNGGRLAVSIRSDDTVGEDRGAAQVYRRNETNYWFPDGDLLTTNDGADGDKLGDSIAIHGDLMAVGAIRNSPDLQASGAVYVFQRNSEGYWEQSQKLVQSGAVAVDFFGDSVAIGDNGNLVAVGAINDDEVAKNAGALYIFERQSDEIFLQTAQLADPEQKKEAQLGREVAIENGIVVGGAWREVVDGQSDAGSVLVFNSTVENEEAEDFDQNRTWADPYKLTVNGTAAIDDFFGSAIALSCEGTLVIGAPGRNGDEGAAYLYFSASFLAESDVSRRLRWFHKHRKDSADDDDEGSVLC